MKMATSAAEKMKRFRRKRLAAGLCVDCGQKNNSEANKFYCKSCRQKHNERARKAKQQKRQLRRGFLQRLLGV